MPAINFKAKPYKIGQWTILRLPAEVSDQLPSRSPVMVEGTINGYHFQTPLEPDGKASHWFYIDESMRKGAGIEVGDTATLEVEPLKVWPEPVLPADWTQALADAPDVQPLWKGITTLARWEWLRWINATKNPDTRNHRIEVSLSKLRHGERRPCCFNRAMCTDPYVSKNGLLLAPN